MIYPDKIKKGKYVIDCIIDGILEKSRYDIIDNNCFTRNNMKTAEKALRHIKKCTTLLALRDQECLESRGYEFKINKKIIIFLKTIKNM